MVAAMPSGEIDNVLFLGANQRSQLPVPTRGSVRCWRKWSFDKKSRDALGADWNTEMLSWLLGNDSFRWKMPKRCRNLVRGGETQARIRTNRLSSFTAILTYPERVLPRLAG